MIEEIAPHHRVAIHRDAARRLDRAWAAHRPHRRPLDRRATAPTSPSRGCSSAARRSVELAAFRDASGLSRAAPRPRSDARRRRCCCGRVARGAGRDRGSGRLRRRRPSASGETAAHEIVPRQALAQIKQGDPAGALRTLSGVAARDRRGPARAGADALRCCRARLRRPGASERPRRPRAGGSRSSPATRRPSSSPRGPMRPPPTPAASCAAACGSTWTRHDDLPRSGGQRVRRAAVHHAAAPLRRPSRTPTSSPSRTRSDPRPQRLGAARGHAFARTLGGEAKLLAGRLDEAEVDLIAGEQLHHAIAASTGEAFSLQRRAEVATLPGSRRRGARAAGRRARHRAGVRRRFPSVRPHLRSPHRRRRVPRRWLRGAGGGRSRRARPGGDVSRLSHHRWPCRPRSPRPAPVTSNGPRVYEKSTVFLAEVVMRLPAWHAALDEVRGHIALAQDDHSRGRAHFVRSQRGLPAGRTTPRRSTLPSTRQRRPLT